MASTVVLFGVKYSLCISWQHMMLYMIDVLRIGALFWLFLAPSLFFLNMFM